MTNTQTASRLLLLLTLMSSLACGDDDPMMDAGDDGSSDVREDTTPVCVEDSDCDDALFCNGAETCDAGQCLPGALVECDDGIECTIDACDEAADACGSFAPDTDGDGAGDAACVGPEGPVGTDCDDNDPARFPGNIEVCDAPPINPETMEPYDFGVDEDCDLTTFGRIDFDRDGAIDIQCGNGDFETGERANGGTDCDDLRPEVRPGSVEACDRVDNDCDETVDEGVAVDGFADIDRDGYGDDSMPMSACPGTVGFVAAELGGDCDDEDPTRNPGQVEICDMIDNDCNGIADPEDTPNVVPWYADVDGDGFGDPADSVLSCEPITDRVLLGTDCDDLDAGRHPASPEMCNGVDDDCNGLKDFEIAPGDFEDDDADGIVDLACGGAFGIDCDDRNPASGPGGREICDGRDNDCDEDIDEGAMDSQFFFDGDGDGFGTDTNPDRPVQRGCSPAAGYVAAGGDCDDTDADRSPGATEACNTTDDDCDGAIDEGGTAVCGCEPGSADCDEDGRCEVDTTSDATNCGGCGIDCSMGDGVGTGVCLGGRCLIIRCEADLEDCDSDTSNGCETDLTSLESCGDCGNACGTPERADTVICDPARGCMISECDAGFDDCDENFSNGCETSLDSVDSCGACFRRCGDGGAPASCEAGTCVFECDGFDRVDCDADETNGCEAFAGDDATCGTSCEVCSDDESCRPVAESFECVPNCAPGFFDCDGERGNGCERAITDGDCGCGTVGTGADCTTAFPGGVGVCVSEFGAPECRLDVCTGGNTNCGGFCSDTSRDTTNCGECGNDCGIGSCIGGACTCPGGYMCDGICLNRNDRDNCGTCGNRCLGDEVCLGFPGPECVRDCGFGFEFCEATATCEDTSRSPNCGFCGNDCDAAAVVNTRSSFCDGSTCQNDCAAGFGDCDGDPTNGCEAVTDNDPDNCGGCGISCGAGGTCALGRCDSESVAVSVGGRHSCAIRGGGRVICWGDNDEGQLGQPPVAGTFRPVEVALPANVEAVELALGIEHSCAFTAGPAGPQVYCWGANPDGRLGCGVGAGCTAAPEPVVFPTDVQPMSVTAGDVHTCAMGLDTMVLERRAYCWGSNDNGRSGINATGGTLEAATLVVTPDLPGPPVPINVQSVVAGGQFSCAVPELLSIGQVQIYCWGNNGAGQAGIGAAGGNQIMAALTQMFGMLFDIANPVPLALGASHACATVEGQMFCWGDNSSNQVGGAFDAPTLVSPPSTPVRQMALMADRTCVIGNDGEVYCRGNNPNEELDPGNPASPIAWTRVTEAGAPMALGSGPSAVHQCLVDLDGSSFCWGDNGSAQIGQGSATPPSLGVTRVIP